MSNAEQIRAHFAATEFFYKWVWGTNRHRAMHAGFEWQSPAHDQAVLAMNALLADAAHVETGDRILDAGCGIGGSSFWLSEERGAIPTGIDLCPRHIDRAWKLARQRRLPTPFDFRVGNYLSTEFADESFDVFWAQESSCYAADKTAFLAEAFRVLKPGGRIVIGDTFLSRNPASAEKQYSDRFAAGYALAPLMPISQFRDLVYAAGFEVLSERDITPFVQKASRRMHRAGWLLGAARPILKFFGRTGRLRAAAIDASIAQRTARECGLGIYIVLSAIKPLPPRLHS